MTRTCVYLVLSLSLLSLSLFSLLLLLSLSLSSSFSLSLSLSLSLLSLSLSSLSISLSLSLSISISLLSISLSLSLSYYSALVLNLSWFYVFSDKTEPFFSLISLILCSVLVQILLLSFPSLALTVCLGFQTDIMWEWGVLYSKYLQSYWLCQYAFSYENITHLSAFHHPSCTDQDFFAQLIAVGLFCSSQYHHECLCWKLTSYYIIIHSLWTHSSGQIWGLITVSMIYCLFYFIVAFPPIWSLYVPCF